MFVVSLVTVASAVPFQIGGLTTRTPSPALASISSRHWDTDVDGLMVCGKSWRVSKWLHEYIFMYPTVQMAAHSNAKLKLHYWFLWKKTGNLVEEQALIRLQFSQNK